MILKKINQNNKDTENENENENDKKVSAIKKIKNDLFFYSKT